MEVYSANTPGIDYKKLAKQVEEDFVLEFKSLTKKADGQFKTYLDSIVETFVLPAIGMRKGIIAFTVGSGSGYLLRFTSENEVEIDMEVVLSYGALRLIVLLIAAFFKLRFPDQTEVSKFHDQVVLSCNKLGLDLKEVPDIRLLISKGLAFWDDSEPQASIH